MSDEDSEPEDAHLRALRSVWLSLPDEEPPTAGMAELMAAARAKAELFAQPPWWRRVLSQLRKPPVLAFATLLVVIGGAIAIGRRGDPVEPSTPVATPPAPSDLAAPTGAVAPAGGAAPTGAADGDKEIETESGAGQAAPPPPTVAPAKPSAIPKPKPMHHAAPAPALAPPRTTISKKAPVYQDDDEAPKDTVTRDVSGAKLDAPKPAVNAQDSTVDIVSAARAAAARGDCAEAKALSARAGAAAKQLAADPAIAKCAAK